MSTEIANTKTFEERMMDRIRESIGELLSDEDLKKIVERGVEKALFETRTIPGAGWNATPQQIPSIVDKAVSDFLGEKMRVAVAKWLDDNPDKLLAAVDAAVSKGAGQCMLDALDGKVHGMLWNFRNEVAQSMTRQ